MRTRAIAAALAGILLLAAGTGSRAETPAKPTPEELMRMRFPQPVKVADIIGLPLLDDADSTIGHVRSVVRTAEGKIKLIVPYGGLLGWGHRLVAVPIEVVGIAGRQLAALDMTRPQFDSAPAWDGSQGQPIGPNEVIRIALYRR